MFGFFQWNDLIQPALRLVEEHWAKVVGSLVLLLIGIWWGRWRAWRRWARRDFLHRLNISLNTIEKGRLKIRTLVEKDMIEILLNQAAVEQMQAAAKKATPADPILKFGDADEC